MSRPPQSEHERDSHFAHDEQSANAIAETLAPESRPAFLECLIQIEIGSLRCGCQSENQSGRQ